MRENRKNRIALKKAAEGRRETSKRKEAGKSIEELSEQPKHLRLYEGSKAIPSPSEAETRDVGSQRKGKDVAIGGYPQQSMQTDQHHVGDRISAYQRGLLPFASTPFVPTVASPLHGQYAAPWSPSHHLKGPAYDFGVQESGATTATRQSNTFSHHLWPSHSSVLSQDSPPSRDFDSSFPSLLPTHSKSDAQAHSHGDSNIVIGTPELIQGAQSSESPTSSKAVRPHASPAPEKHGNGQHSDLPNSDPIVHADINDVFEYQPEEWRLWDSPPVSPIFHHR